MTRSAAPLLLLLALAAPAAAQGPAAASTGPDRALLYRLDWGPVALGEFRVREAERPEGRSLAITARSVGAAALIYDFSLTERTLEQPDGERRFTILGDFGRRTFDRLVTWAPGSAPEVEHRGDGPEDEELTPVPQDDIHRTLDPAAAVLAVLDQVEAGRGCAGEWPIYDGVRRMDLLVRDEGAERIEADRDWTYAGPALRCRLGFRRVGGFPVDADRKAPEAEFDRVLWIAEMPAGPTPVRLKVSWPLGYAIGRIDLR